MSIVSRIGRAYLWARATSLYGNGKYNELEELLTKSSSNRQLGIYEQILYANTLAGLKNNIGASQLYNASIDRAGGLDASDAEYVKAYCRFMLAKIDGNHELSEDIKRSMRLMKPPARLQHFVNHDNIANW